MIDEELLARLVRDAGDAVEVPADAPARVLAARTATLRAARAQVPVRAGGDRRAPGGLLAVLALAAAIGLVVLVVAVGGHGRPSTAASSGAEAGPTAHVHAPTRGPGAEAGPTGRAASPFFGPVSTGVSGAASTASGAPVAMGSTGDGGLLGPTPAVATKVVETGQVSVRVGRGGVPAAVTALGGEAAGLGGYVASSTTTDAQGAQPATASVTLRVPVAAFGALVADARRVGTVLSATTSGQDVTGQTVDLGARITALDDTRTQYEQILAKAQSIGDILSVEAQLGQVQTQIEQLQGQLDVLDGQAAYSTLTVQLTEPAPVGPPPAPVRSALSAAWHHAGASFTSGVDSVVAALGGIAVFVVVVGALGLAARVAWVLGRRRLL